VNLTPFCCVLLAFFGACSLVAMAMFHPRAHYLTLRNEGFEFCALFRKNFVTWQDVANFEVTRVGMNAMVAWDYAAGYQGSATGRAANQAIARIDAALPDTYSMIADQLASLMEAIRADRCRAVSDAR
jgi:hypothetical protein